MRTVAIDWDGTLVDATTQQWLPDAVNALYAMVTAEPRCRVVIHSCRANSPSGLAQIEQTLSAMPWLYRSVKVVGKPDADVYVDNLALRFTGDWKQTMREIGSVRA